MQFYASLVCIMDKPLVQVLYRNIAQSATDRGTTNALKHVFRNVRTAVVCCSAAVYWRHIRRCRRAPLVFAPSVDVGTPLHIVIGLLHLFVHGCIGCVGFSMDELRKQIIAAGEEIVGPDGKCTDFVRELLFSLYWSMDLSTCDIEELHASQSRLLVHRSGGQNTTTFFGKCINRLASLYVDLGSMRNSMFPGVVVPPPPPPAREARPPRKRKIRGAGGAQGGANSGIQKYHGIVCRELGMRCSDRAAWQVTRDRWLEVSEEDKASFQAQCQVAKRIRRLALMDGPAEAGALPAAPAVLAIAPEPEPVVNVVTPVCLSTMPLSREQIAVTRFGALALQHARTSRPTSIQQAGEHQLSHPASPELMFKILSDLFVTPTPSVVLTATKFTEIVGSGVSVARGFPADKKNIKYPKECGAVCARVAALFPQLWNLFITLGTRLKEIAWRLDPKPRVSLRVLLALEAFSDPLQPPAADDAPEYLHLGTRFALLTGARLSPKVPLWLECVPTMRPRRHPCGVTNEAEYNNLYLRFEQTEYTEHVGVALPEWMFDIIHDGFPEARLMHYYGDELAANVIWHGRGGCCALLFAACSSDGTRRKVT